MISRKVLVVLSTLAIGINGFVVHTKRSSPVPTGSSTHEEFLPLSLPSSTLLCLSSLSSSSPTCSTNMHEDEKNAMQLKNDKINDGIICSGDDNTRREFLSSMIGAITVVSAVTLNQPGQAEAAVTTTANSPSSSAASVDYEAIFKRASKKALGGGKAGASAAVVQVCSLMWLRTAMNYQYRYGGNLGSSLKTLMEEGGIPRLYQGLPFALLQGPLTRFGDTAANIGVLALLDSIEATSSLPLPLKTLAGSVTAGLWRIVLMPVDSSKTVMQVEGADGLNKLWSNVRNEMSISPLFQGAVASAAATAVGHYPWFLTYNYLDGALLVISQSDDLLLSLLRSAVLGLSAACVSDCCSNSLRVIKTTKQTAQFRDTSDGNSESNIATSAVEEGSVNKGNEISYREAFALVIEKDGWTGLLGRGLQTRLLTNAIQGAVFSVLWKYFQNVGGMQ
mmetsp:Transcript_35586/g.52019  ORF Transcript_35586/g.52019 Transcript_35586/m.52019 type:complete len:449 (+) Transcript_35586:70-1416(+)